MPDIMIFVPLQLKQCKIQITNRDNQASSSSMLHNDGPVDHIIVSFYTSNALTSGSITIVSLPDAMYNCIRDSNKVSRVGLARSVGTIPIWHDFIIAHVLDQYQYVTGIITDISVHRTHEQ